MSASTATPPVPPRPVRAQAAAAAGADKLPEVPPRPLPKRLDRSVSPGNYPRSPLYDVPSGSGLYQPKTNEASLAPLARKPSVQHLPSIGQEGSEYADIQYQPSVLSSGLAADAAAQTRSIGEDLKLHAPKPSLPTSSAKAQVQAVTRTDPQQAASHGFGKPSTPVHDEFEPLHQIRSRASFSRPGSTASAERRASTYTEEQGPAETGGMRVPINPLLGDVQAPSPASFGSALTPTHTGGIEKKRPHHSRTRSGREVFLPPGSYGLHGHGVVPNDRFEQDWYQKHPEQLAHEEQYGHGVYESIGSGRGNFALSSDDLNKIVRNTASRGSGFGTNPKNMSYPDEQIGYMASEQYSSTAPNYLSKLHSNSSQPHVESPLRKASLPTDDQGWEEFKASKKSASIHSKSGEDAIEEDDALHVVPDRHHNKVTGGEETMHETEETHPYVRERASNSSLADEHGYTVPILAGDEVARNGSEFMQPAISPKQDRRGSAYDLDYRSGDHTPSSRPASRPGSVYGLQGVNHSLSRFTTHHDDRDSMHTPLEDVAEYEPLFPEDEDEDNALKRPVSHAERFKQRPEIWKHRFPSQDIWEDTPDSSMHITTVSTPELSEQHDESKQLGEPKPEASFEHPSVDAARKGEPSEAEKKKLISAEDRLAKSKFAPHLRDDMPTRPGMQPRFPSQDIWEDSPDSQHLVTTVGGPQMEEETSPVETKPSIPPRPVRKSRLGEDASSAQVAPSIPARPTKYSVPPPEAKSSDLSTSPTERKAPVVPDRPKPQVPARPAKKTSGDSLSKTISATSAGSSETVKSPPVVKAKPVVPARPGNKIQSLKGNFMNDLNQKLGLGPPKEKEPEPEVEPEAKPLEDARKGRARGPQRRAPAKSPSAGETAAMKTPVLGMFTPQAHWHIDPGHGQLNVHPHDGGTRADLASAVAGQKDNIPKPDLSVEKTEQMDQATVADAPPPPTIDTTPASTQIPQATALPTSTAGELTDPESTALAGPPAPSREKSDPIEKVITKSAEEDGGNISQNTTKSSDYSGQSLRREAPDPNTDVIPLSQHTTVETQGSGATLEKADTHDPAENEKAEEEPVTLRDEQVSSPAPEANQDKFSSISQGDDMSGGLTEEDVGAKAPKEPMAEDDVSYKRLEEMTAKADGKGHAKEEEGV